MPQNPSLMDKINAALNCRIRLVAKTEFRYRTTTFNEVEGRLNYIGDSIDNEGHHIIIVDVGFTSMALDVEGDIKDVTVI